MKNSFNIIKNKTFQIKGVIDLLFISHIVLFFYVIGKKATFKNESTINYDIILFLFWYFVWINNK
jgi:hypothetical protein